MKLVLTLLARNEADIVDALLTYHLNAGVDFVIATDNQSDDGTTEILESYARGGYVHLIREQGRDMRQGEWVTRMARLAAGQFAADWIIHGDADEFYWPRGESLKDVLAAIPSRFGAVRTFVRTFLLRPDDGGSFVERMTARFAPSAPINDPASIFRPGAKVIHRADPRVVLGDGTHTIRGSSLRLLHNWYPIELLHFPFRTIEQTERKFANAWRSWTKNPTTPPPHYYAKAYTALEQGRAREFIDSFTLGDQALARGLAEGSVVIDTRLRDALRELRADGRTRSRDPASPRRQTLTITRPDIAEEVQYAVDAAVLNEADVTRLQRRIDELDARVTALARPVWSSRRRASAAVG